MPLREVFHAQAIDAIFKGTVWLDTEQVQCLVVDAQPRPVLRWLEDGAVFAVERGAGLEFPAYAFDEDGQPVPALRNVLIILKAHPHLAIAAWFESTSSMLGGRRPRELLAVAPTKVIEAARDHVYHGQGG